MEWIVKKDESGEKLLKFLSQKVNGCSLKQLKRFLEAGSCTINGYAERFASKIVYEGDKIAFQPAEKVALESKLATFLKSRILYEDEDLFIYDKPPGIASDGFKTKLLLIHRLDRETSGVLMFAKHEHARLLMIELFRQKLVKKHYLAVVDGVPKKNRGLVDNFLGKKHSFHGQAIYGAVPKEKGLHAVTEWKLEKVVKEHSLLSCYPKTGRTHQIRVHLSEMGYPILGDYQYCRQFHSAFKPKRCLLHAFKVKFIHPIKNINIEVEAKMPQDFLFQYEDINS